MVRLKRASMTGLSAAVALLTTLHAAPASAASGANLGNQVADLSLAHDDTIIVVGP
jgi:hypothetical protein